MKAIEKTIIRQRAKLRQKAQNTAARGLKEQYEEAIQVIKTTGIYQIKEHFQSAIKEEPIERAFIEMYDSCTGISQTYMAYLEKGTKRKSDITDMHESEFHRRMRKFARDKEVGAGTRIVNITGTTKDRLIEVAQLSIETAELNGLGVEETKNVILENIRSDYKMFTPARARLIAQTEINTGVNIAIRESTDMLDLPYQAIWSTSRLANVRDSHRRAEVDSIARGGVKKGEKFSNGLEYPGDPTAPAAEVCNCHCLYMTEII